MSRWQGKIAVITGASSGIGLAIAKAFVRDGIIVVGLARRQAKMEAEIKCIEGNGKFIARKCDVSISESVRDAFEWIQQNVGVVQIMVNNAGLIVGKKLADSSRQDWETLFNVNVVGLLECTKYAIKAMKMANVEGHVININSILGHEVRRIGKCLTNVYPATKHAVTAITKLYQMELLGGKIRFTSINPGLVRSNIIEVANIDIESTELQSVPILECEDVADAIVYVIGTPQCVEITDLTIKAFGEDF